MTLMGPTSRRTAALPQRVLEKVLTPLVVHSQIWLPAAFCVSAGWACAALDDAVDAGEVDAGAADAGGREGVWLDAWADVVLPVMPMATAIATAAIDNAPKIHGRRSLSSVIARLSSCGSVRAPNMTDC